MVSTFQKLLTEQFGFSQQDVSRRLRVMGKIQKTGKWVRQKLNDRQIEKRKNTCDVLLARYKRKW